MNDKVTKINMFTDSNFLAHNLEFVDNCERQENQHVEVLKIRSESDSVKYLVTLKQFFIFS
jgi:hypothetical protein